MYTKNAEERLIREAVREILRSSDVSRSPSLRRTLVVENKVSDWQLAQIYAFGGRGLLTESQNYRAKLLIESVLSGLVSAANWMGNKASQGMQYLQQAGRDAVQGAGKVLTAVLKQIPRGEELFDLLKDFSQDIGTKMGEFVQDAIQELTGFVEAKKESFVGIIFGSPPEGEVLSKLERLKETTLASFEKAKDKLSKVKEFFDLVYKGDGVNAVKLLSAHREFLGSVAKVIVKIIIEASETVKKKIAEIGIKWFGANVKGQFLRALITILGSDAGSENVLDAGLDLWSAGKKLLGGVSLSLERGSEAEKKILKIFPELVYGIISGDNITEILTRIGLSQGLDVKAIQKLWQKAISQVVNIIKKYLGENIKKNLPRVGVDPESKTGKAIMIGLSGVLGFAKGGLTPDSLRDS